MRSIAATRGVTPEKNEVIVKEIRGYEVARTYHLPLRNDLAKHASVFDWGFFGEAPKQLALAILVVAVGEVDALEYYVEFAEKIISRQPYHGFTFGMSSIRNWVDAAAARRHAQRRRKMQKGRRYNNNANYD